MTRGADSGVKGPGSASGTKNEVALWSGVAAFFGSLLAIGIFDVFDVHSWAQYLGALIVAGITAGAVYAKQRLDAAKGAGK